MKSILKAWAAGLFAAFLTLQLFQIDKTNPEIVQAETIDAMTSIPPDVKIILGKACNDCHTNNTRYPWYSYVQPNGWFLRSHVEDGRRHLNFSKFATYDANKREKKIEEVCDEVTEGKMPLPSYLWIHRDAVLTDAEKKTLCDWTKTIVSSSGS